MKILDRKADTRSKIQMGGLVKKAGLEDLHKTNPMALLGVLIEVKKRISTPLNDRDDAIDERPEVLASVHEIVSNSMIDRSKDATNNDYPRQDIEHRDDVNHTATNGIVTDGNNKIDGAVLKSKNKVTLSKDKSDLTFDNEPNKNTLKNAALTNYDGIKKKSQYRQDMIKKYEKIGYEFVKDE